MAAKPKPTSEARASVLIKAAMEALNEAGGSLPLRDVKKAVAQKVTLDEHDLARYEKTGYIRWEPAEPSGVFDFTLLSGKGRCRSRV